ncbi:Heterogeneous nuclear ribonucleoprotein K [Nymphon striatum]|nr:Heterogeneous nuclear ribonucleoprotein K [Nymphon striatum]
MAIMSTARFSLAYWRDRKTNSWVRTHTECKDLIQTVKSSKFECDMTKYNFIFFTTIQHHKRSKNFLSQKFAYNKMLTRTDGFKRPASDMQESNGTGDDGGPAPAVKRPRMEYENIHMDARFLIQSRNAGAIIGKGGQNINRLRNDVSTQNILTLGGSIKVIGQLLMDIIPRLDDYSHNKGLDFRCELRMLVHQSHAGSLIGRAGFKIKELRERTGASIKIYSDCLPRSSERVVQVSGTPEIVVGCIQDICESISQSPVKQPSNPYDPHDFDEFYAKEYGGFGGMDDNPRGFRGGRGGRGNQRSGGRSGARGGTGGGRGRNDGGGWNNRMEFGRNGPDGPRGMGGPDNYGGNRGGWGEYDDDIPPMNPRMMSRGGGGGPGSRPSGGGAMRNPSSSFGSGSGMGRGGGNRDSRMGGGRGGGGGRGSRNDGPSMYDRQGNGNMGGGSSGGGGGSSGGSGGGGMNRMGGSGMSRRMQDDMMDVGGGGESNMRPQIHGNMQQNFDNYRNQGPGGGGGNSTQVSVPKDIAGAIIGKGGNRIKRVRAESGANVTIAEAESGSNDRIITISGSDDQIQRAQFLLQKCSMFRPNVTTSNVQDSYRVVLCLTESDRCLR